VVQSLPVLSFQGFPQAGGNVLPSEVFGDCMMALTQVGDDASTQRLLFVHNGWVEHGIKGSGYKGNKCWFCCPAKGERYRIEREQSYGLGIVAVDTQVVGISSAGLHRMETEKQTKSKGGPCCTICAFNCCPCCPSTLAYHYDINEDDVELAGLLAKKQKITAQDAQQARWELHTQRSKLHVVTIKWLDVASRTVKQTLAIVPELAQPLSAQPLSATPARRVEIGKFVAGVEYGAATSTLMKQKSTADWTQESGGGGGGARNPFSMLAGVLSAVAGLAEPHGASHYGLVMPAAASEMER
jgi:hypothetical protein